MARQSVENRAYSALSRRHFIGGSDARIIMGDDEAALIRLWREKRGEVEPEDLSGNLIVQLGLVTEDLNRRWYEANTGQVIKDVQRRVRHPALRWMAATLDGRVEGKRGGVRGQVHAAVVVLGRGGGREIHATAAAQYVGDRRTKRGAFGDHRRRQMGRDHRPCRSALPAPHRHGREEVLALRRERRAPSPLRRRAAAAADRGGAHRRYELVERLGGVRRGLSADPGGSSRA